MNTQPTHQAGVDIQYVNARNGNKPASIKGACGNYYTISDAAIAAGTFRQGARGTIGYRISQKGFKVALTWNGARIPEDPQSDSAGQPPENGRYYNNGAPQPPARPVRPTPQGRDGSLNLAQKAGVAVEIAGACIASGLSQEDARQWYIWTLRTATGLKTADSQDHGNHAPPPPPPPLPPPQAADGVPLDDEIPF